MSEGGSRPITKRVTCSARALASSSTTVQRCGDAHTRTGAMHRPAILAWSSGSGSRRVFHAYGSCGLTGGPRNGRRSPSIGTPRSSKAPPNDAHGAMDRDHLGRLPTDGRLLVGIEGRIDNASADCVHLAARCLTAGPFPHGAVCSETDDRTVEGVDHTHRGP